LSLITSYLQQRGETETESECRNETHFPSVHALCATLLIQDNHL
jgi:hypothetical protein